MTRKKKASFRINVDRSIEEISVGTLNKKDIRDIRNHCNSIIRKTEEVEALSLIYTARFSYEFLKEFTDFCYLSKEEAKKTTVHDYFTDWVNKKNHIFAKYPYSEGAIIGLAYVQIGLASEKYIDLIPNVSITNRNNLHWGLSKTQPIFSTGSSNIRQVVKRIRNSLAHGNFELDLSEVKKKGNDIHEYGKITFFDTNMRMVKDTFEISIYLKDLIQLCKAFREVIFDDFDDRGLINEINQSLKENANRTIGKRMG